VTTERTLRQTDLLGLAADLLAAGVEVIAPVPASGRAEYRRLARTGTPELALGAGLPAVSLKQFFLPMTEPLVRWRTRIGGTELEPISLAVAPRVVLGARPCDAAAIDILDKVMGWDYQDEPWFARRAATTIVTLACDGLGDGCFCSSMGLGPADRRGSDLLLLREGDGYHVEVLTEKGEALTAKHAARFGAAGDATAAADARARAGAAAGPPIKPEVVRAWLAKNFEHPLWPAIALRCHGCGACAAVCPSCHCFDIVDEPEAYDRGTRRRNWDTCQAPRFTLHGSGHNPRPVQPARLRQRVMHKLFIYPERFGAVLCTGCGRCSRACPAGVDLPEILTTIMGYASAPATAAAPAPAPTAKAQP
jgi:ferredoxin